MSEGTLYDKVWDRHAVTKLPTGQTQLFIGLHLIHEVTSPQAFSMLRERGLPPGLDMVFDVRFLRNPHWEAELRPLDGHHPNVAGYVSGDPRYEVFMSRWWDLARVLLPALDPVTLAPEQQRQQAVDPRSHLAAIDDAIDGPVIEQELREVRTVLSGDAGNQRLL